PPRRRPPPWAATYPPAPRLRALRQPLECIGDGGVRPFLLAAAPGLALDPVVDLVPEDRDIAWRGDAQTHLLTGDREHLNLNPFADHDALARLPCQHQHRLFLLEKIAAKPPRRRPSATQK